MKKILVALAVIIIILFIIILLSYNQYSQSKNNEISQSFISEIASKIEDGQKEIFLSEITNFDWNSMCFAIRNDSSSDPYMVYETMRNVHEKHPDFLPYFPNELLREKYYGLFIFSKGNEIQKIITFNQLLVPYKGKNISIYPDVRNLQNRNCVAYSNSRLILVERSEPHLSTLLIKE